MLLLFITYNTNYTCFSFVSSYTRFYNVPMNYPFILPKDGLRTPYVPSTLLTPRLSLSLYYIYIYKSYIYHIVCIYYISHIYIYICIYTSYIVYIYISMYLSYVYIYTYDIYIYIYVNIIYILYINHILFTCIYMIYIYIIS